MASSDDFRKQLKAGNITEALALALSKAVELKITTWVASAADELEADRAKPGYRLQTRINMLEGDIENEIGDRFLGTGPYRELRQFHGEQVAQGNTIIQNNLKSLQKLFEILVKVRYQEATTPEIEPELLDVEPQLFEEWITDVGLAIEPPESVVEEPVVSPETEVEELTESEVGIPSQTIGVEDSEISEDTGIEEDVTQLPPAPPPEPDILPTPPIESQEVLDEETEEDEDDWDDSVLDLLESLPVEPPPPLEVSESELDEDWGDLVEENQEPEQDTLESNLDQDWGILTLDDFDSPSTSPDSDINESNSELDEDWGDLVEPEPEPDPNRPIPSMESLNLEEDEDWGEWVVEDEQQPLPEKPIADQPELDLEDEEDWEGLDEGSDPFTVTSAGDRSASNVEEDWDAFAPEELEPFSDFLDEDITGEASDPLENLTSSEPTNPDFRDNQQTDSSIENSPLDELDRFLQESDTSNQSDNASDNAIAALSEETKAQGSHSNPAIPDDSVVHTLEEALFSQSPEESNRDVSTEESEDRTEKDLDGHPNPDDKRALPPPPPPSRFPHGNQES